MSSKIEVAGLVIEDKRVVANTFNTYFQSVFTRWPISSAPVTAADTRMGGVVITESGILNLLLEIDTKKAPGPDNISNVFLKRYAQQLSPFLQIIFSESLSTASLPKDWLCAKVIPIHKEGNKLHVETYRPISLTSCCCKLMEHIVSKAVMTYLQENNILYPKQHGFRKGLSTITQLLEITHDFASIINSKFQADAIFIDFSKAYDRVVHCKLIEKIKSIGIEHNVVEWIAAYLSNRTQYVTINNYDSDQLEVYSGVPQGSVLGPLLFLIYVNDIADCAENGVKLRLFADDLVIYTSVQGIEDQLRLNTTLSNIARWCDMWGMEINLKKTQYMTITHRKSIFRFNYTLMGNDLIQTDTVKYLGITFTSALKWNTHIDNTCTKAFRTLGFLRRKLTAAPSYVKLTAYKTLVRPILEYGSIVWNPHQKGLSQKLESIQNKALRFIYHKYSRHESVSALRSQAALPTLVCRRRVAVMKFLFMLCNNNINIDKRDYVQPPHRHSNRTCHNRHIRQYPTQCDTFRYSYFPWAIEIWNTLPKEIVETDSVDSFVAKLESYFGCS